jgi:long-chain fatty acid transport protein
MKNKTLRHVCCVSTALLSGLCVAAEAQAGGFAVREQSGYFLGSAFAGSAAGGDISSIYWNSAATASQPGLNFYSSYSPIIAQSDVTATGGVLVAGAPFAPRSTDIGTDALVPASYATYQLNDRLFAGLAINSPYGFTTTPDKAAWAGSPAAITSKVFSADLNPTVAYKLTPEITVGLGAQVEYFKVRLNRTSFAPGGIPLSPFRALSADDWGAGATAGIIWQPRPGTSFGVGYRSAVGIDLSGTYARSAFILPSAMVSPALRVGASASTTLPEEITFSVRQAITECWTFLATLEWQNWSRLQNTPITAGGFPLETLNFNWRDGWYASFGVEYNWSPLITVRAGVAFEKSPIEDTSRDILLPDSDRLHLNIGASYKWSDRISFDIAYAHLFYDSAPYCIANPLTNGGTTHCTGRPGEVVALNGSADNSVNLVSVGLRYKLAPQVALEPYK